ncbi:MAG: hypothetical protein Q9227_008147 [Pyrenula ochraceoflavens]
MTYVNPQSVMAIGILFPLLGAIAVGLRFWFRKRLHLGLQIDDWLCIPALVSGHILGYATFTRSPDNSNAFQILLWAEGGLQVAGAKTHTFGWHSPSFASPIEFLTDDSPPIRMLGKLQTAFDLIHVIALGLLKLSVCFFYRRIFRGPKFNIASWIAIVTVILWIIAFFVAIAAACGTHIEANWASLGTLKTQCVDTFRLLLVYAVTDVIVDLAILLIPIPLVFRLQMPLRRKVAVCGVLLVGALATACGITRMVIFVGALTAPLLANSTVAGLPDTDDLGVVSVLLFWGMVELGVGMTAICLPTLRPLFAGWSVESVVRSVRSAISLSSLSSGGKSTHGSSGTGHRSLRTRDATVKLESEEHLTGTEMAMQSFQMQDKMELGNKAVHSAAIEGPPKAHVNAGKDEHGSEGINVERAFMVDHDRAMKSP